jgi:FKBP-type peptidyl-prolyl cis-trans isomerase
MSAPWTKETVKEGSGPAPQKGSTVTVHAIGSMEMPGQPLKQVKKKPSVFLCPF